MTLDELRHQIETKQHDLARYHRNRMLNALCFIVTLIAQFILADGLVKQIMSLIMLVSLFATFYYFVYVSGTRAEISRLQNQHSEEIMKDFS